MLIIHQMLITNIVYMSTRKLLIYIYIIVQMRMLKNKMEVTVYIPQRRI